MTQRASPVKYNLDLLIKFCNENHITLLKDYLGELVNRETRIEGKCLSEGCENTFEKTFRQLYKINGYCTICSVNIGKIKKIETNKIKFGYQYPAQSEEIKQKSKDSNLKKYGVENPLQSQEIKDKIKSTNLKKYGLEHPSQSEEVKDKIKSTNLKKYGVECSLYSKEIREKTKLTWFNNYGVEYPSQSDEIKEKKTSTCLKNFGVEHPLQSQEVRDKIKETCLEKYGVEHPLQSQEVRDKIKETCLEKYGVEYVMQVPELADKSFKASYSRKEYALPSSKIIQVQGYEPYALDELVRIFNEEDIITGSSSVPEIWYNDDEGLKHRHFVDIFIPSQNKCIEVKSTWTYQLKNVLLKQQAGKELGYNYEIWIYNSKGEKVECIV